MSRNTSELSKNPAAQRSVSRRSCWRRIAACRLAPGAVALALLAAVVGCGTNLDDILYQTGSSVGRTSLDLLLTDFANAIADRFDDQAADADQDDDDGDDADGDGDDGDGDDADGGDADDGGGDLTDLTGDPVAGEALFASCTACHCADAAGGCMPTAPGLIGADADVNDEYLRGDAPHPTKPDLTDQEIVDLAAFLASLED